MHIFQTVINTRNSLNLTSELGQMVESLRAHITKFLTCEAMWENSTG